jgi:hypothetical protein
MHGDKNKMFDTLDLTLVIPAATAIAILLVGMVMLVSGIWASRDQ